MLDVQLLHFIVPSAPRNFMLAKVPGSPDTLSASWTIPESSNGVISGYTISCSSSLSGKLEPFIISDSVTTTILENLTPYTVYTCTVLATTAAGDGNSSEPQIARTDEDGKLLCIFIK